MCGVAIAGATGLTGSHLLDRLLAAEDGGFVFAPVRRPLDRRHPRLIVSVGDFLAPPRFPEPPGPISTAFCTLGASLRISGSRGAFRSVDLEGTVAFGRWAHAAGARHLLCVTSVMTSPGSPNFYLRVKADAEEQLAGIGFTNLDLFQPSFLAGDRAVPRRAERAGLAVASALSFALQGPLQRFRPIEASVLAAAMVVRAQNPGTPGITRHEWAEIRRLAALHSQEHSRNDVR